MQINLPANKTEIQSLIDSELQNGPINSSLVNITSVNVQTLKPLYLLLLFLQLIKPYFSHDNSYCT